MLVNCEAVSLIWTSSMPPIGRGKKSWILKSVDKKRRKEKLYVKVQNIRFLHKMKTSISPLKEALSIFFRKDNNSNKCLPCVRHCSRHFTYVIVFDAWIVLHLLSSFYRWRNWSTKRWNNLHNFGIRFYTLAVWLQNIHFYVCVPFKSVSPYEVILLRFSSRSFILGYM